MSEDIQRVAFVTGGAQGIGQATAVKLAQDGAAVAVVDLKEEACAATVERISLAGGKAIAIGADVADMAAVQAAVDKTAKEFGRLDILVNNAGVTRDNLLFKMTEQDWDTVMGVHLRGAFNTCKSAQKYMVEQKYGKIVNLSSRSALGNRGQANYSTAKAGLQGFTATLAIELGPFNINVNAIAPGYIATPMTDATAQRVGADVSDYQKAAAERTPLRRVGQPEDIANVVAFLASDASGFVTGQTLYVTGGPR
ncbi:3-oxoacyl-[acyl-carrier protein] reductase [Antricoccus suffuscus]|uniref:3-oxoacyl-[acyl-carrier protein] reductase n=1 Tax=Antricoccus suffuscus TaxID=1629062 RepID=A0A2T0ZVK8_9ACTN|nr:3-oxoacyl-ACP reductase FabG [Antricoccus suffuscus]PRZ40396.1 3-oxoacyl-[acyl-carrier protein] reductase [Antricoccus suffuscus]